MTTPAFDWSPRTRLVFGAGTVEWLGQLAAELGARRAFLVTDSGLVGAGHAERGERALAAAGIEVRRYDGTPENPTSTTVENCRAALGSRLVKARRFDEAFYALVVR